MALEVNTGLSSEQAKFAITVENIAPYLLPLWDFEKREFIPKKVDRFLSTASSGEKFMCQFFIGVWTHNNTYEFDIFEAMAVLGQKERTFISDWVKNPFWA